MNLKLIIVWSLAILVIGGIGVFGYLNRNLIYATDEEFTPGVVETDKTYTCNATTENGTSTYRFLVSDNIIDRVAITFIASSESIESYEAASTIHQAISSGINGVSSALSGGLSDFTLTININIHEYDKMRIEEMTENFSKLSMVIDSISEYEIYKQAISQIGNTYTCE